MWIPNIFSPVCELTFWLFLQCLEEQKFLMHSVFFLLWLILLVSLLTYPNVRVSCIYSSRVWCSVPFTCRAHEWSLMFVSGVGGEEELLSRLPHPLSILIIDSVSFLWSRLDKMELSYPLIFDKTGYKTVYRNWLQNYCFFYRKILNN